MALLGCFGEPVLAQFDSSRLDLGYTHLNKDFTQTIVIRGSDLEKMPFTNLSDALAPWLYGAYSGAGAILYIVDGNPVSDPNNYPIQDIEEVVLVQDATALAGSSNGQRETVLITTRRGKQRKGITLAAQTGLVNAGGNGVSTDTRMYHQYYAGMYRNTDKISFGLSGGFQRDVMPLAKEDNIKVNTPYNLQRWRLNGYFDWRLDAHNLVKVTMNYTPQKMAVDGQSTVNPFKTAVSAPQHYLQPGLRWNSELLPGLHNELQGTYLSSVYKESDGIVSMNTYPVTSWQANQTDVKIDSYHWRVRDRLYYSWKAGGWRIEPAVNYSYEKYKETISTVSTQTDSFPNSFPGFSVNVSNSRISGNVSLLTPAVDITFRRMLNVQLGMVMNLSKPLGDGKRDLPYARVSVDLLRMGRIESRSSLKLFGSYSKRGMFSTYSGSLADLNNAPNINQLYIVNGGNYTNIQGNPIIYAPFNNGVSYWSWESGLSYSTAGGRLLLQYTLERRNLDLENYYQMGNSTFVYFQQWHSTLHHFDIRAKLIEGSDWRWETGLNLTLLRSKAETSDYPYVKPGLGDAAPDKISPTGGWVNRIQLKRLVAGLDLLYHFHQTLYYSTYNGSQYGSRVNSILVPNVYAGYKFHSVELFAESRGLVRNRTQLLMDERRYYTLGGKFNLQ
jgi:hypothetical protein